MTMQPADRAGYGDADSDAAVRANRAFWNGYRDEYLAEHGEYLGGADLLWCPEGLRESAAGLLGPLAGRRVLEIGCGAGQGSRYVAEQGGLAVGVDISEKMIAAGRAAIGDRDRSPFFLQADARALPLAAGSVDLAFSAFGAIPFVADAGAIHREVARVLTSGGRWVFATSHPIRWAFLDDPGPRGLRAVRSYFDRSPYRELDEDGTLTYAEFHRTLGDHVAELVAAGFRIEALLEPEWQAAPDQTWGGWSALRGALLPGTLILIGTLP